MDYACQSVYMYSLWLLHMCTDCCIHVCHCMYYCILALLHLCSNIFLCREAAMLKARLAKASKLWCYVHLCMWPHSSHTVCVHFQISSERIHPCLPMGTGPPPQQATTVIPVVRHLTPSPVRHLRQQMTPSPVNVQVQTRSYCAHVQPCQFYSLPDFIWKQSLFTSQKTSSPSTTHNRHPS